MSLTPAYYNFESIKSFSVLTPYASTPIYHPPLLLSVFTLLPGKFDNKLEPLYATEAAFQAEGNDDFAEFDFDEEEDAGGKKDAGGDVKSEAKFDPPKVRYVDNDDDDEEEAVVEDEESEFNHFEDEEEFEG